MPKVKGRVLRDQFDSWQKRGLIDSEVAKARYIETFWTIAHSDSEDAAVRFTICLVLADAFFETLIPFWRMTVAMARYKLGRDFEQWFKKKAGLYKTKSVSAFELFAFIKQPELIYLHDYLWYYRGHSEIKRVGWGNYLEFCEFVEALEKDLLKFKKAMKEMVLLWEDYVRDKFAFFTSEEFSIGDFRKKRELILALYKSVSKERKGIDLQILKTLGR